MSLVGAISYQENICYFMNLDVVESEFSSASSSELRSGFAI